MRTVSSLKYKSLTTIYFHQSEHKFDCNPKYTIPYVKVCDNSTLPNEFLTSALFIKAHTLLPTQVCFPFSGGTDHLQQKSSKSTPRPPFHSTQCSCHPAILYICLVLSL